ncbi:MAG: hypothetical protein A3A86_04260 [Elusimicrobia bacterium RIFCSPLOWO2_01_FULL_60_11]|nr:MAG: hypothetical protein A3A86_04260 [Elusimicrobia bacterium RIFCSPLOWO2_01_FULL_60_11]
MDILLVDDFDGDAKITLRVFNEGRIKHTFHRAVNGQEALDYVHNRGAFEDKLKFPEPDFILMDIQMPVLDGHEALKQLKEDPRFAHIPVAMLTTSSSRTDIQKSFSYGAVSFITKPMIYDEFTQLVDNFNRYWLTSSKLPCAHA